jgi:hypothetical protein
MYYVGFSHHLYNQYTLCIMWALVTTFIIIQLLIIKVVTKAYIIHKVIDYKGGD